MSTPIYRIIITYVIVHRTTYLSSSMVVRNGSFLSESKVMGDVKRRIWNENRNVSSKVPTKRPLRSRTTSSYRKSLQHSTATMYLQLFADFLSIITILMCLVQKIPQIMNLYKLKTAAGISLLGLFLELTSYTVMTSYNYTNEYSFLSYLEYPVLLLQDLIIIYLVLLYLDLISPSSFLLAALYFFIFGCFLFQIVPKTALTILAPMCTPISASSKIAQLAAILRAKNSESISVLTWVISTLTNLTRVFTIWMDSADLLLLSNFIISVSLSGSIMLSAIYYRRSTVKHD
ncbi:solute carrier family 66 member 3 isoform X1 [Neodiprion virginianus]|uniref:solute carrier family 66 member 3 isoform X1 n=2 Tax=Neodiprion TaxID=270857 RepID=UPI001EE71E9E|nr:solute carrier family 66 member 3 isoform X1 [Neodiprion virginianus]